MLRSFALVLLLLFSCNKFSNDKVNPEVTVIGQMKDVMWKGKLAGNIHLDSIPQKKGLYGLGPLEYLQGEIMIMDGTSYIARITAEDDLLVTESYQAEAPFFVYSNVDMWKEISIPKKVKSIKNLEAFIIDKTKQVKTPFAFKLKGQVHRALIHVQNLPEGSKVSSPKEAHQGQVNFTIVEEEVDIIGFFSTSHQGIFTHHDTFLHMHLITADKSKMGHLDAININQMKFYIPVGYNLRND